jgi:hypothetical protein
MRPTRYKPLEAPTAYKSPYSRNGPRRDSHSLFNFREPSKTDPTPTGGTPLIAFACDTEDPCSGRTAAHAMFVSAVPMKRSQSRNEWTSVL